MAATLVRRALMFLLLPILTTRVSPEEYGSISVAATVSALAIIVMGLGLETPVFRSWFNTKDDAERRHRLLAATRTLLLGASIVTASLAVVLVISIDVTSEAWSVSLIVLALIGAIAQTMVQNYALPLLRAMDRTDHYLRVQMTIALTQVALLTLLVLVVSWGPTGWMLGVVLAQWAGVAVAGHYLHTSLELGMDWASSRELLSLGMPMVPHAAAHWSLGGVDRLVLMAFVPAATVGIYSLVYAMSALVGTVLTELNKALMNEYGQLVGSRSAHVSRSISRLSTVQVVASLVISFAAAAIGPPAFRLLFPEDYALGAGIIPWIVVGQMFFGIYYVFVDRLVLLEGKSGMLAVGTILGALVNLGSNFLLVPSLGMRGAALATAIGYCVMLVAVGLYVQRTTAYALGLSWRPMALILSLLAFLSSVLVLSRGLTQTWFIGLALVCGVVALGSGWWLVRGQLNGLDGEAS